MSTSFQSLRVGSGKTRGISSSDRLVSSILTCFIIKGVPTVMPPKQKGNNEPYMDHIHGANPYLARRWGIICFYAPVSVWSVIEWMMSHAIGNFEEGEAMLADDLKAVQRKIVKDSFADKMAALKKQEAEFSDLVSDLFALRSLHDSLQEIRHAWFWRPESLLLSCVILCPLRPASKHRQARKLSTVKKTKHRNQTWSKSESGNTKEARER